MLAVGIRAWAGFPIRDTDGTVLGSLTVVDTHPRAWTDEQVRRLAGIARAAGDEMALRADLDISQRSADELAHRLQASDRAARASDRDARRAYDRAERADALANAARRQAGAAVELAETLQQSLTPQHPPRVPGMEIAARHRGPTDGHSYSGEVLGDFYDVFATPTRLGRRRRRRLRARRRRRPHHGPGPLHGPRPRAQRARPGPRAHRRQRRPARLVRHRAELRHRRLRPDHRPRCPRARRPDRPDRRRRAPAGRRLASRR